MSLEEQIENLKKIAALKEAARDENAIRQYLSNARQYRDDAKKAETPVGQFTLAYEALHALAMAFLTHHAARTSGEGHRSTALQLSITELTQESRIPSVAHTVINIHRVRNDTTYFKPIPPVTDALAKATLALLDAALAGATKTIQLTDVPSSPRPGR